VTGVQPEHGSGVIGGPAVDPHDARRADDQKLMLGESPAKSKICAYFLCSARHRSERSLRIRNPASPSRNPPRTQAAAGRTAAAYRARLSLRRRARWLPSRSVRSC
jgi:hypothetical protein